MLIVAIRVRRTYVVVSAILLMQHHALAANPIRANDLQQNCQCQRQSWWNWNSRILHTLDTLSSSLTRSEDFVDSEIVSCFTGQHWVPPILLATSPTSRRRKTLLIMEMKRRRNARGFSTNQVFNLKRENVSWLFYLAFSI